MGSDLREGRGEASALDAVSISCGYGTVVFAQIQLTAYIWILCLLILCSILHGAQAI